MTNTLRQGGVACNVFEGTSDEFVGLHGLTCSHIPEDSCVRSNRHLLVMCVSVWKSRCGGDSVARKNEGMMPKMKRRKWQVEGSFFPTSRKKGSVVGAAIFGI